MLRTADFFNVEVALVALRAVVAEREAVRLVAVGLRATVFLVAVALRTLVVATRVTVFSAARALFTTGRALRAVTFFAVLRVRGVLVVAIPLVLPATHDTKPDARARFRNALRRVQRAPGIVRERCSETLVALQTNAVCARQGFSRRSHAVWTGC